MKVLNIIKGDTHSFVIWLMRTFYISKKARQLRNQMANKNFSLDIKNKKNPITKELDEYQVKHIDLSNLKSDDEFDVNVISLDVNIVHHNYLNKILTDTVVFQIHGGGYITPLSSNNLDAAKTYSRTFSCDTYSIDYSVAYEAPFPKALNESLDTYKYLAKRYKKIILVGNSAGGGIILAMTSLIIKEGIQKPFMIAIGSPFANLAQDGLSYKKNRHKDVLFGSKRKEAISEIAIPQSYMPTDTKNPLVSPIYLDYTAFPPMIIQTGSHEMLLSDSISIYNKSKASNVKVKLNIYKGMWHAFYSNNLDLKESKIAWKEIIKFYNSI